MTNRAMQQLKIPLIARADSSLETTMCTIREILWFPYPSWHACFGDIFPPSYLIGTLHERMGHGESFHVSFKALQKLAERRVYSLLDKFIRNDRDQTKEERASFCSERKN